jgi:hypothetical protein
VLETSLVCTRSAQFALSSGVNDDFTCDKVEKKSVCRLLAAHAIAGPDFWAADWTDEIGDICLGSDGFGIFCFSNIGSISVCLATQYARSAYLYVPSLRFLGLGLI